MNLEFVWFLLSPYFPSNLLYFPFASFSFLFFGSFLDGGDTVHHWGESSFWKCRAKPGLMKKGNSIKSFFFDHLHFCIASTLRLKYSKYKFGICQIQGSYIVLDTSFCSNYILLSRNVEMHALKTVFTVCDKWES